MRTFLALLFALALIAPAYAWMNRVGGGGGCTHSLNFSQACNSAYLAVF